MPNFVISSFRQGFFTLASLFIPTALDSPRQEGYSINFFYKERQAANC